MSAVAATNRASARRVLAYAGSCHPGPCVAVAAASAAYAWRVGRGPGAIALVGLAVLSGQLAIGWQNDALDVARDRAAARRDKPIARGLIDQRSVELASTVAFVATVPLSFASGWRAGLVHVAAVASAATYNLRLRFSAASFLPYVVSFGLLPCFVTLGLGSHLLPSWWLPAGTAALGFAAHLANVLPDLEADRHAGVLGLPHRLGRLGTVALTGIALLVAAGLLGGRPLVSGGTRPVTAAAIVALAVAAAVAVLAEEIARRRPSSRAPFGLVILAALCDVALFLIEGGVGRGT